VGDLITSCPYSNMLTRSTAALLSPINGVDVGVLGVAAGTNANMGEDNVEHLENEINNNNDNARSEEEIYFTSDLYDVHVGLEVACYHNATGSCCTSGKADVLPTTLGLSIDGIGEKVSLPLSESHANAIKSNSISQVIQDKSYHRVYSVPSTSLHIRNPAWKAGFNKLLEKVAYKLGVDPNTLSAKAKMLLYMEKGSRIDRHKNALPDGKFSINAGGGEDEDGDEIEEITTNFDLGPSSGDSAFSCYFLAHYNDCEVKCSKVLSGTRLLLAYSLHTTARPMQTANSVISSKVSLRLWDAANNCLASTNPHLSFVFISQC
jgi:hypothetical protein